VVTADQQLIETASADRGLVFDPIKTQQLPLNGRQTYQLMVLTPGVLFTQEAFGPGGHSGSRGWDVTNGSTELARARTCFCSTARRSGMPAAPGRSRPMLKWFRNSR